MARHFIQYLIALFCLVGGSGTIFCKERFFYQHTLPVMSLLFKDKDRLSGMWQQIFSLAVGAGMIAMAILPGSAMAASCKARRENCSFISPLTGQ